MKKTFLRLSALSALLLLGNLPASVAAAEFCADAYYVEQTFDNGARWDMCWEHRSREGIVLHHVHYTPRNGVRRSVLSEATIAQIHVPYDDNGARYHDVSDYGLGNDLMLNLTPAECPGGSLLSFSGKNVICRQLIEEPLAYRLSSESAPVQHLSLFSVSAVAAYNYIPQWRFFDNGTIEPGMGATGALQRFASANAENRGWLIQPGRVGLSHLHNYYWKLDFDLGSNANDDVVEELNFNLSSGRRIRSVSTFTTEAARSVDPSKLRSWRIREGGNNAFGHPQSYEILLQESGHKDIGPSNEPFTYNDFYVTKYNSCEIYASHNPGFSCATDLSGFVNGESLVGQDIVTWVGLSFYHVPRAEDAPMMDAHWNRFQIVPRDWHSSHPYNDAPANQAPVVTSPGNRTDSQFSTVSLAIQASDPNGDSLQYSAIGLPNGLNINSATGVITGTASASGTFTPQITVSDGSASQSISFTWTISAGSQNWTSLGTFASNIVAAPATGWSFHWNQFGSIGASASYSDMLWNGSRYDSDGIAGLPDSSELTYGNFSPVRSHAGRGSSQGPAQDRFVISRYTTQSEADFRITSSNIGHVGCQWTNGLNLRVYIDDVLATQVGVAANGSASFDTNLGTLPAGAKIDVAVGPSGSDGCDEFTLNYAVQSSPATGSANNPPVFPPLNNRVTEVGTVIGFNLSATDADGDVLSYSATGLPAGISINSTTGRISGTPTSVGQNDVIVSVSDGIASRSGRFTWTITQGGAAWAEAGRYSTAAVESRPANWSFHWNRSNLIGVSPGYSPLLWNGSVYDSDGAPGQPDNNELAFGYLRSSGGHTGRGTAQGAAADRHVIARFTAPQDGDYRIIDSSVGHNGCQWSNGLDARLYVNDILRQQLSLASGSSAQSFNRSLGTLAAGSRIELAVGPNGSDGCDAFALEFAVQRSVTSAAVNQPPQVTSPGERSSELGSVVNLNILTLDPEGNSLTFEAFGLPPGLSINPSTGAISGSPTTTGDYTALIGVSDSVNKSWISFPWNITVSGSSWSSVGSFGASVRQTPPTGWSFLWNRNAAIGTSSGYVNLLWNGAAMDSDGQASPAADSSDLNYGRLTPSGGHPGKGSTQATAADRYVISRYTTSTAGTYRISNGSLTHNSCQWTNGIQAQVRVNDVIQNQFTLATAGASQTLNLNLGTLVAGSRIDVAVGPNGADGCDGFAMDYQIERLVSAQ